MIIVSHLGAVHLNDYVYFKCARLLVVLQVAFQFLLLFGSEGLHIVGVIIMQMADSDHFVVWFSN
jgi:hypothetical protein